MLRSQTNRSFFYRDREMTSRFGHYRIAREAWQPTWDGYQASVRIARYENVPDRRARGNLYTGNARRSKKLAGLSN
jgi:hypothetical protein